MSPLPMKDSSVRSSFGTHGHIIWRDLYRAIPAVTWELGFYGLILMNVPIKSPFIQEKDGVLRICSNPDPNEIKVKGNYLTSAIRLSVSAGE